MYKHYLIQVKSIMIHSATTWQEVLYYRHGNGFTEQGRELILINKTKMKYGQYYHHTSGASISLWC